MKKILCAAAFAWAGCTPVSLTKELPQVEESGCSDIHPELEIRLADITDELKKYHEGGPYPYNNKTGYCKNLTAKEGSTILYVIDINPEEEVLSYTLALDSKRINDDFPYNKPVDNPVTYPFTAMEQLKGLEKGKHLLEADLVYKSGKKEHASLEILIE